MEETDVTILPGTIFVRFILEMIDIHILNIKA